MVTQECEGMRIPAINATDTKLTVDTKFIELFFPNGNIWTQIGRQFQTFMHGIIKTQIETEVRLLIMSQFNAQPNQTICNTKGHWNMIPDSFFTNMTLNLDTKWNATLTDEAVTFKVKGSWGSDLQNNTDTLVPDTPLSPMQLYDRRLGPTA